MTVKEFCLSQKTIAYHTDMNGIEIKAIEYGINDYVYCISNSLASDNNLKGYHHVKIHEEFSIGGEIRPYIKILGADRKYNKVYLDEAIRTNVDYGIFKE